MILPSYRRPLFLAIITLVVVMILVNIQIYSLATGMGKVAENPSSRVLVHTYIHSQREVDDYVYVVLGYPDVDLAHELRIESGTEYGPLTLQLYKVVTEVGEAPIYATLEYANNTIPKLAVDLQQPIEVSVPALSLSLTSSMFGNELVFDTTQTQMLVKAKYAVFTQASSGLLVLSHLETGQFARISLAVAVN